MNSLLEYEGNKTMIFKNLMKITYNTTLRDIFLLPFFNDFLCVFVNVNMYFDSIDIILNKLLNLF